MAEVLIEFESSFEGPDGKTYEARACGRERDDGRWEGWLEFIPAPASGEPIRTGRETTQPNRADLLYWATGLTTTYIGGALLRLLTPPPILREPEVSSAPAFEAPADGAQPVLDPFYVYGEGEDILRQQLSALDPGRLRTIIRGYGMASEDTLAVANDGELISLIMSAVRKRAA